MMLQQMTSSQLTELEAFWGLEDGFGEYKQDWRTAQISAVQANVMRGKDSEPFSVQDFVMQPEVQEQHQEQKARTKYQKIRAGLDGWSGVKVDRSKKKNA